MKGIQIERNFTQFVVFAEDSILSALSKITANQSRLIFVVSEAGILQGVLTDGDFRRWIASCGDIDLNRPVTAAMNGGYTSGFGTVLDVVGVNYHLTEYDAYHAALSQALTN